MESAAWRSQTADCVTGAEKKDWLERMLIEFRGEGATYFRYSHHPDLPDLIQLEGWWRQPDEQGPLEWALVAAEEAG